MQKYYPQNSPFLAACGLLLLILKTSVLPAAEISRPQATAEVIDALEQQRQQERERALQQQNQPHSEVRLRRPQLANAGYPAGEIPCFTISRLRLVGDAAAQFQWALASAEDARRRCLGGKGIRVAIDKVQNAILAKGFVTTRIMAQEQDLRSGVLTMTLLPGRIGKVSFSPATSWRARLWNAVPAKSGELLNLRDIEQALENFRRVPDVSADIRILPGQQEGTRTCPARQMC